MDYRSLRRMWRRKLGAEEETDSDHIFYFMQVGQTQHRIGKVSHSSRGSDDVLDYVITDTTKRMKVSKVELGKIVNCSISKNDYLTIWQERHNKDLGLV